MTLYLNLNSYTDLAMFFFFIHKKIWEGLINYNM